MKQKDTIIKNYMSNPEYFADAFNYYLFDGEQIVRPEKLVEKDNSEFITFNSYPTYYRFILDNRERVIYHKYRKNQYVVKVRREN